MTTNHRKKSSRHRGSWTHGHGEKKKHRGAGSRGGRGNAGSGKRGDAKKPSFWKIKNREGKHGFTNPTKKLVVAATIAQLNTNIHYLIENQMAKQEGKLFLVDLSALGVDKLIATGDPKFAFKIVVKSATDAAVEKIKAAGGTIELENASSE
ncbi:MAG: uL15 family ribosomal protein [Candidatus Nanoarchaeia archaeon]|nr:uL15 family ribosomal protein [Candidatus Nanoarchaeia archaeon]